MPRHSARYRSVPQQGFPLLSPVARVFPVLSFDSIRTCADDIFSIAQGCPEIKGKCFCPPPVPGTIITFPPSEPFPVAQIHDEIRRSAGIRVLGQRKLEAVRTEIVPAAEHQEDAGRIDLRYPRVREGRGLDHDLADQSQVW